MEEFNAWNILVDELKYRGIGGVLRHNNLVKWEFYYVVSEDFLASVGDYDTNTCFQIHLQK